MIKSQDVKVYRRHCGLCGREFWTAVYTDLACCKTHGDVLFSRTKKGKRAKRYGR